MSPFAEQLSFEIDAREAPSREDCIWAAAFFDGEGCVNLTLKGKKKPVVAAQMLIGNTNLLVLEWYRERWGGGIYRKKDRIEKRPQWQWQLSENRLAPFLEDILPLLKIKAPAVINCQAFLRLKLSRLKHSRFTSEETNRYLPFLEAHRALELDLRPHVLNRRKSA